MERKHLIPAVTAFLGTHCTAHSLTSYEYKTSRGVDRVEIVLYFAIFRYLHTSVTKRETESYFTNVYRRI